jgi:hypothetical protein
MLGFLSELFQKHEKTQGFGAARELPDPQRPKTRENVRFLSEKVSTMRENTRLRIGENTRF